MPSPVSVQAEDDGTTEPAEVDAVVVPLAARGALPELDDAPASTLRRLVERGEASGRRGRLALAHDHQGRRFLVVGTGPADELDAERVRELAGAVVRRGSELGVRRLRWIAPDDALAPAIVEGTLLAAHRHERARGRAHPAIAADLLPRRRDDARAAGGDGADGHAGGVERETAPVRGDGTLADAPAGAESADGVAAAPGPEEAHDDAAGGDGQPRLATLVVRTSSPCGPAIARAAGIAEGQNRARALQHRPPNDCTPRAIVARARELEAEGHGLRVEAHVGEGALRALGMGMFAGVAQGSAEPPALVVVRWDGGGTGTGTGAADDAPTLGLVGKAVTHDTGGYSLKPGPSMVDMKLDMSGGAAVLEALGTAARLGLPRRAIGVIGATENLVGERAMKPGDVLTAANGVTVEVTNTDAEGRLVLGDCLLHAASLGAERLVDVATLTGGVVTALGTSHAGLMGRDDAWLEAVRAAGERAGERLWRLPLEDVHRRLLRSRAADLTNSGGRVAHAIQGAAFLERFTGERPWAHVDIAAMSHDLPQRYLGKGASGWGVRLLTELLAG